MVMREMRTETNKSLDLAVIVGARWVIGIENKIYHGCFNPFEDYECVAAWKHGLQQRTLNSLRTCATL
jgi:hypothetical protein